MYDAMANRDRQASDLGAQKVDDLAERRRHVGHLRAKPCLVDKGLASHALGEKSRMNSDAFDLAFQEALQLIACTDLEELKLDA